MKKILVFFLFSFVFLHAGVCTPMPSNEQLLCETHKQYLETSHNAPCCVSSSDNIFEVVDATYPSPQNSVQTSPSPTPYIHTKKASSAIDLVVVGKTSPNQVDQPLLTNALVTKIELLNAANGNSLVKSYNISATDGNLSNGFKTINLNLNETGITRKVFKNIQVKVYGKYGSYDIDGISSDAFAIRPDKFTANGTIPGKLFATKDGINYLTFKSLDVNGNDVIYSNSIKQDFFLIPEDIRASSNGCYTGALAWEKSGVMTLLNSEIISSSGVPIDSLQFSNTGSFSNPLTYFGIGEVKLKITEDALARTRIWAGVDNLDPNITDNILLVESPAIDHNMYSGINRIYPESMNVEENPSLKTTYDRDWLYMANNLADANTSIHYDLNITGFHPIQGTKILKNFNSNCYAEDISVNLNGTVSASNNEVFTISSGANQIVGVDNTNTLVQLRSGLLNDVNNSSVFIVERNGFVNGVGQFDTTFNIDRSNTIPMVPMNPIRLSNLTLDINNINTLNTINQSIVNDVTLTNSITFYYGRVYAEDLVTSNTTDITRLYAEIYKSSGSVDAPGSTLKSLRQNWFVNPEEDGNVNTIASLQMYNTTDLATGSAIDTSDINNTLNNSSFTQGEIENTVINGGNVVKGTVHYTGPSYLWFSKYRAYNPAGNCLEHYCTSYEFIGNKNEGVNAGKTKGNSVTIKKNKDQQRRFGGKTFR